MGNARLSKGITQILIPVAAIIGIGFTLLQWVLVSRIKVGPEMASLQNNGSYNDFFLDEANEDGTEERSVVPKCAEIQNAIALGATSFLFTEYKYLGIFTVCFGLIIFLFLGSVEGFSTKHQPCNYDKEKLCKPALANALFSTIAFVLSATTYALSGYLGMKIATYANARTTLEARKGVGKAFITAFRSGAVMGFLLAANGLLVLHISINIFKLRFGRKLGRAPNVLFSKRSYSSRSPSSAPSSAPFSAFRCKPWQRHVQFSRSSASTVQPAITKHSPTTPSTKCRSSFVRS